MRTPYELITVEAESRKFDLEKNPKPDDIDWVLAELVMEVDPQEKEDSTYKPQPLSKKPKNQRSRRKSKTATSTDKTYISPEGGVFLGEALSKWFEAQDFINNDFNRVASAQNNNFDSLVVESMSEIKEIPLVDESHSDHPTLSPYPEDAELIQKFQQALKCKDKARQSELSQIPRLQELGNNINFGFAMLLSVLKSSSSSNGTASFIISYISKLTNLTLIQKGLAHINQALENKKTRVNKFQLNRQKKLFEAKLEGLDIEELCATVEGRRLVFKETMTYPRAKKQKHNDNKTQATKHKYEEQSASIHNKDSPTIIGDPSEQDTMLLIKDDYPQPHKRKFEHKNSSRESKRPRIDEAPAKPFDDILLSTFLSEFLTKASINQDSHANSSLIEDDYSPIIADEIVAYHAEIIDAVDLNMNPVISTADQGGSGDVHTSQQTRKHLSGYSLRSTGQFQFLKPPSYRKHDLENTPSPMIEEKDIPGSNI